MMMTRSLAAVALAAVALVSFSTGCAVAPEEADAQGAQEAQDDDDEMKVAVDDDDSVTPKAGMNCSCPAGQVFDNGLCFPACANGYAGVGPVCWQRCASGFSDDGAFCRRNSSVISAMSWPAENAGVAETDVVQQDHHDVGSVFGSLCRLRPLFERHAVRRSYRSRGCRRGRSCRVRTSQRSRRCQGQRHACKNRGLAGFAQRRDPPRASFTDHRMALQRR